MASENWPLYLMLGLYVLIMIVVSIIANRQNAASVSQSDSSLVTTHFLAAKGMGAALLLLTTFASVFSGYTVVGVPNEAGYNGFTAIRWIAGIGYVGVGALIILPRLRRLSDIRAYSSPGDFVFDRYRSISVRVITSLCLCVPQIIYISVQFHALGATLAFFTNYELGFNTVVCVSAFLILLLECAGGMRTVAYTDSVQGSVMICVFICLPIALAVMYAGGFAGQVVNSDELPCPNDSSLVDGTLLNGCLNYRGGPSIGGEATHVAQEFYLRTPSAITTVNNILFSISLLSFVLNPHVIQRAMAARHAWQLRFVYICLSITPCVCTIPGILTGISYLSNWYDYDPPLSYYPAFQATLVMFKQAGGFREVLAYVAILGAVAGIMSTADSALIGVSNTFVCDIFQNMLTPNLSARWIVWIGKAISLVVTAIGIGVAISLQNRAEATGEPVSYGVLLAVQGGLLFQAFPAFALGLYTNISWKSILAGYCFGITLTIILVLLVTSDNNPFVESSPQMEKLNASWSALTGVLLNFVVCLIGHCIFFGADEKESDEEKMTKAEMSFSDLKRLNLSRIQHIMQGIDEPVTKYRGILVIIFVTVILCSNFHWIGTIDPELEAMYGEEGVKQLLYNGEIQAVIAGFPSWAFASMIWYGIGTFFNIWALWVWNTDEKYEGKYMVPNSSFVQDNRDELMDDTRGGDVEIMQTKNKENGLQKIATEELVEDGHVQSITAIPDEN